MSELKSKDSEANKPKEPYKCVSKWGRMAQALKEKSDQEKASQQQTKESIVLSKETGREHFQPGSGNRPSSGIPRCSIG